MNFLTHITQALHAAAAQAATVWHDHVEPYLANFLKNTAKAELDAARPIVEGVVQQEIGGLVSAAASNDFAGFAAKQADIAAKAADALKASAINVAVTSLATAVNIATVTHPDVLNAQAQTLTGGAPGPTTGA